MQKRFNQRQLFYWRGWNAAATTAWDGLAQVPTESMTPDQKALWQVVLDYLTKLFPEEHLLKPKLSNAQLAAKYQIAPRTVTNWRREGCPFEDGKWSVFSWMSERRYLSSGPKAKFGHRMEMRKLTAMSKDCLLISRLMTRVRKGKYVDPLEFEIWGRILAKYNISKHGT